MQEEASESRVSKSGIPQATPLSQEEIHLIEEKKLGLRYTDPLRLEHQQKDGISRGDYITIWNTAHFNNSQEYNEAIHKFIGLSLGIISPDRSINWHEYKQDMVLDSYLAKRFPDDLPAYQIIDDSKSTDEPYDTDEYFNFGKSGTQRIVPERILKSVSFDENDIALIKEIYKDRLSSPINDDFSEGIRIEIAVLNDIEDILKGKVLTSLRSTINQN